MVKTEFYCTKPFRNTPQQFVARILHLWLKRYWWILALPVVVCGAMAVFKWEWIIVALMIILLIYPFVLAMVYFNYALAPENRRFIKPLRLDVSPNGMKISYLNIDDEDGEEVLYKLDSEELVPFEAIKSVIPGQDDMVIMLTNPRYANITIADKDWMTDKIKEQKTEILELFHKNGIKFA